MRYPGITRVEAGRQAYHRGIHRADRIGFEDGSKGITMQACGYRHAAFVAAYERGWERGALWRRDMQRNRKRINVR